ncbi:MAG: IS66 family transposase [Saprospiraceae bacterium]
MGANQNDLYPKGMVDNQTVFGDQQSEPSDVEEQKETITYDRSKKKSDHKGRQLLSGCEHLSVEEKIIDTDHDESDIHIGDEVSEKLAYKPGKLYRIRYIRRKYKKANQDTIITAPPVEEPIARCEADVSLLANVVVSKYVDHIPEYRQQQIYKREGVVIAPSTMNGWVHQLSPYMKLMSEYIKQKILQSGYIQQDESTIKVMDGKKQSTQISVGARTPELSVYFKYKTAALLFPFIKAICRQTHTKCEMIDKLYGDVEHFNCWAHGRRKFVEAMANDKQKQYALGQIQKLYAIEQKCRDNGCTYDDARKKGKAANPILEQLKDWLDAEAIKVTPRSPIGKAISYLTTRWQKFTKYTGHGIVEIDNNIIENAIRPLALGRKNYLFAGNHDAATTIAYYYTIFGTCKALGVNPYDYMVWFLNKVPTISTSEIHHLAPDQFKKSILSLT